MQPLRRAGSNLGRAAHDLLFRNVHNRFLIYNACWEDPRIDRELLRLDRDSRVVMLTSAGCNALDYLLEGPAEIHAVDVNPRQNALLQLKLALFRLGNFDDLYAMFGQGSHDALERVYAAARPHLDDASADFWDRRMVYFDRHRGRPSFYYHGTAAVERYYRLHARIYDATRWSFLVGRREIIRGLPAELRPDSVLEVGCGTGTNLMALARRFPTARITGLDASADMLARARRRTARLGERVRLAHRPYLAPEAGGDGFDLILFSYALSMFNPGWEAALDVAVADLSHRGLVAVVDFENSPSGAFRRWMGLNHVRMEGHLPRALRRRLQPTLDRSLPAYGGLWKYCLFIGRRPGRGRDAPPRTEHASA